MKTHFQIIIALLITISLLIIPSAVFAGDDANPGDIVINEFMANPATISDTDGEWLEIHNTTGGAINIDGWLLSDDGTDSHMINNGGTLVVPANGKLVLCRNIVFAVNGGVTCNYQYSSFILGNNGDEIILTEDAGTQEEISRINYPSSVTFDSSGQSAYFIPSGNPPTGGYFSDNGNTSRWGRTGNIPANLFGTSGTNYGTPGGVNTQTGDAPTAITLSLLSGKNNNHALVYFIGGVSFLLVGALFVLRRRKTV